MVTTKQLIIGVIVIILIISGLIWLFSECAVVKVMEK